MASRGGWACRTCARNATRSARFSGRQAARDRMGQGASTQQDGAQQQEEEDEDHYQGEGSIPICFQTRRWC